MGNKSTGFRIMAQISSIVSNQTLMYHYIN
nr:MAG TPA: hypothetical protein [Caudoviricetes sp.]